MFRIFSIVIIIFLGLGVAINTLFTGNRQQGERYHEQYYKLEEFYKAYTNIASEGGWEKLPPRKDPLKVWMMDSIVPLLEERLSRENYIAKRNNHKYNIFDRELEKALINFQNNNNLAPTGALDPGTITALNVTVEERIAQIRMNMERWKAIPGDSGGHHIMVNIPSFKLAVIANRDTVISMKTIVGSTQRQTPEIKAKMTHIMLNPEWVVPPTILKEDVLPKLKKDVSYLSRNNMQVVGKNGSKIAIDADTVNWQAITFENFPYNIVQSPGPNNALGVVKFVLVNSHAIHMHDTPTKNLFSQAEPTLSSGCIRVSNAVDLAVLLLKNNPKWPEDRITKTIADGNTVVIRLEYPIDVYIAYFTAWVNHNGQLQFRKDVYQRDIPV